MANEKVPPNGGLGAGKFSKLTGDPSEGVGDLGDVIATPMDRQSVGFKELLAGMESLKASVTSQLNMQSRQGTSPSKQVSNEGSSNVANMPASPAAKLRYAIGAQFEVAIESWEVCEGFILDGIVLQMAAQMTDDKDSAALQVRLEAFATIGDYLFTVSAEIPNIQSGQDLDIVFRLTMRLPAAPEGVCKALQSVSGGGQQYNPSALVDDSLGHILQRDRMAAVLQLRVTKPAGQSSFRFNSLVFRFYGKINWKPELKNSEIGLELVDGDFLLVLAKDVYDNDAKLLIEARLYGTFVLGKTHIDAAVGFSRDHLGENRIQFELQVQPNMLSAMEFLNKLPVSKDGNTEPMNKGSTLSSLELPLGLQAMKTDLSQPNLKLSLAGSYSLTRSKLEMLQFTAFSRESLVFCLDFIDNARLRDLVLHVEIHTWTIVLSGKMDLGRFTATVEIVFFKGIGLRVKGNLASNSGCSLATLARMDIFNDKGKKSSMNIAQEASRANTGGGPPLDLSSGVLTRGTKLSFDLLVLKEEKDKGEQSTKEKPNTGNEQPEKKDADKQLVPEEDDMDSSYHLKRIKFLSHFDLDWQIIQDKVKFENLSICFDVRNPRQENKRKMAGLLYATWRLSGVELFVYILGKKDAKDTDFWAGLNIKKTTRDSSKTAFDIINDPKFAGGEPGTDSKLTLPVKLPPDVKAKPEDQKVAEGLEFDGRLMVHFSKNKKDDKSFVLKDLSVYIDLESPFMISNYKMVGSFFMDLRIAYPMVKEKRDFSCYMKGKLEFENGLYFSLEAEIPMNKKKLPEVEKKPEDLGDKPQKGLESTASKLNMDLPIRKTKVEKYLGKFRVQEEDIVCLVKIGQSKPVDFTEDMNYESRLSTIGDSTQTEHEVSFKSLLSSSYGSPTDDTIKGMVPKDNPLLQEKYQSSMQFAAVMVVRREMTGEKSERKVKAVAATLSSIDSWHIIQGKLWIQDVGLSVIVEWDDKRQKFISGVIQGTIILNNTAALATCVAYSQEVLTVSAVAEMNVKKLFESMDTDVSEEPDLAAAMDEKLPSLMIGIEAKFKEMKLQGYKVEVLATPDFEFFGGFILQALWFTITHSRSVMPHTTDMELGGRMLLGKSVALEIRGKSSRNEIRISWIGHDVSPAKIANGMIEGGLDGADRDKSKPKLPTETGFGDWDKEEKKDILTSGEVVFVKDGSGRRFSSATLGVVLAESTKEKAWMLIDDYIKLKEFALVIKIKAQKDNKKTLEVGLKAEFYLKDRVTKDWPTGFDTIEMVATRWDIKVTLKPKPERTIGDILWCITSGFLDIPPEFSIPVFPIIEMTLNWKTKDAMLSGYFSSDKAAWKVPYIEYVAKINQPHIMGTIKRQGKKSTRVSIAGKLSFLNDLVELDAEYVLLKGPLLIEGHDIKGYYDMIKKIWNAVKKTLDALRSAGRVVGNTATAVVEAAAGAVGAAVAAGSAAIGAAIGGLIGALALGGPFLVGIGGFVIGGLLGGAAWLAAKVSMIGLLRKLCSETDHDADDMLKGFLEGVSPHENENAKGNTGDRSRGGPVGGGDDRTVTVLPGGDEKLIKRFDVDEDSYVELSGSGTSAGLEGELTEFLLEYKYRRGVLARVTRIVDEKSNFQLAGIVRFSVEYQPSDPSIPAMPNTKSVMISKVFEGATAMLVGKRYRIPWQRPTKTSTSSYTVRLAVTKTSEMSQPDQKQEWKIQLKSKVEECFAPESTILDVPDTLGLGADLIGYVFLKDTDGNIRQGVDDRSKIKIRLKPTVKTKLSLLQNGCAIWAATPLREGNYTVTATIIDKEFTKDLKVSHITTLNDLTISGSGLASGKAGQPKLSIVVIDGCNLLSEVDHLIAKVVKNGTQEEQIEIIEGNTSETLTIYSGSYTRPSAGQYEVHILVNENHVGASPYKLTSSEVDIATSSKMWSVTTLRRRVTIQDSQTVVISVYDQSGSSSLLSEDPLRDCQLQAIPVDNGGEPTADSELTLGKLELLRGSLVARYSVENISIAKVGRFKLSLLGGSAGTTSLVSDTSSYVTVMDQRVLTSFLVSGDGLQTGWEKSEANVTFKGFDQYGAEMRVMDGKAVWTLVAADGKTLLKRGMAEYEQGYFTYVRPAVQSEGTSELCFLYVAFQEQDHTVEAAGSPFAIRTESYFDELDFAERSFWYKDRFAPNRLSWSTLYVCDKYGILSRTLPPLFVVESPNYQITAVSNISDGMYRVYYVSQKEDVEFKYNLGGTSIVDKTLPVAIRPLWVPSEHTITSPLSLLKASEKRIVARYTSKQKIDVQYFGAMLYQVDEAANVLYVTTQVTADLDRANTCCIWATLNQTGIFHLHPTYRGLPLTSDAKSHDVQIIVEFDSYLFSPEDEQLLTPSEREWATEPSNVREYIDYVRVSAPRGTHRVKSPFNSLPLVSPSPGQHLDIWPTKLIFTISPVGGIYSYNDNDDDAPVLPRDQEADWRLACFSVVWGSPSDTAIKRKIDYGRYPDTPSKDVTFEFLPDERIVRACVIIPPEEEWVAGIVLETNKGKFAVPEGCDYEDQGAFESKKPDWCTGLKGFWGGIGESRGVDRLGFIWAK